MTCHFPPPSQDAAVIPTILIDAARCWRVARDSGDSTQPRLSRTLAAHNCEILAPVLDSLCLFYEAALGRPITIGDSPSMSEDEHLLLGLVGGSRPPECLNCPNNLARTLDCALCSTRVMLALTFAKSNGETLQ